MMAVKHGLASPKHICSDTSGNRTRTGSTYKQGDVGTVLQSTVKLWRKITKQYSQPAKAFYTIVIIL